RPAHPFHAPGARPGDGGRAASHFGCTAAGADWNSGHCRPPGVATDGPGPPRPPSLGSGMTALVRCLRQTLGQIFREQETLVLLFGASVLYAFFYPTPYLNQIIRDLPIVVVDRDHTALSRQLTRWLDASEAVSVASRSNDLNAAQDSVRAGAAGAVLLIPQDFERHVLRREPAYVE